MPRPKGSKNKAKAAAPVVNYDEIIPALEAEIATLTEQLKTKKSELKAARDLALFTAPYLFFFPSKLIY